MICDVWNVWHTVCIKMKMKTEYHSSCQCAHVKSDMVRNASGFDECVPQLLTLHSSFRLN